MGLLSLFNTCGYIFGPAILVTGALALGLCLGASRRSSSRRSQRLAAAFALVPLAVGLCGALFGLVVWQTLAPPADNPGEAWLALGKVCLAGLVVSVPPLLWSLVLRRAHRRMA